MRTSILFVLVAGLLPVVVNGAESPNRPTPQPRPRLQLSPDATARVAQKTAREASVVTLDQMVVTGTKLPASVPRREAPEPTLFTWQSGGPLADGKLGNLPVSFGIRARRDLLAEDARYKDASPQAEFELVWAKF